MDPTLLFIIPLAFLALWRYGHIIADLARPGGDGGKVRSHLVTPGNILFAVAIASFLLALALAGSQTAAESEPAPPPAFSEDALYYQMFFSLIIIGGVLLHLRNRDFSLSSFFGLDFAASAPGPLLLRSLGLFLLATSLTLATAALWRLLLNAFGNQPEAQEIMDFFLRASTWSERFPVILLAIVIAPLTEEIVFRGFLYPVAKRYCGTGPALLLTAVLFALIHANLAAFLPLAILALCLALAYEHTGSFLTPLLIHSLFNTYNILYVLLAPLLGGDSSPPSP